MEQFLLRLGPVLKFTPESAAIALENLVGLPREGVEGILNLVEQ